jgi:hypothetical protein
LQPYAEESHSGDTSEEPSDGELDEHSMPGFAHPVTTNAQTSSAGARGSQLGSGESGPEGASEAIDQRAAQADDENAEARGDRGGGDRSGGARESGEKRTCNDKDDTSAGPPLPSPAKVTAQPQAKVRRKSNPPPTECPACGSTDAPLSGVTAGHRCKAPGHCSAAYQRLKSLLTQDKPLGQVFCGANKRKYGERFNERVRLCISEQPDFFTSRPWACKSEHSLEKLHALLGEQVESFLEKCPYYRKNREGAQAQPGAAD